MAFVKFFTVCDDEYRHILTERRQKAFDVNAYPSVVTVDGVPYYDSLNGSAKMYCDAIREGKNVTKPTIPAGVFELELNRAYNEGYLGAVIVCPHSSWTDFKHQATIAVKRFKRKTKIDELGFKIKIFDSKQLGAGVSYLTYFFAENYHELYHSTTDFFSFMEYFKSNPIVYVLEDGPCEFDSSSGIKGFSLKKNSLNKFDISHYPDSVIFDKFANMVTADARKYSRNLVFSIGSECEFAGNVIGRIERDLEKSSLCTIQYGVSTASVIGNKALCINLV